MAPVDGKLRILLIHRTKYRDITLPKGKVDPGEMLAETAVREVHEETGIRVSLGVSVGVSRYHLASQKQKVVHYWAAEATDVAIRESTFVPNREIAALEWVSVKKARARLSYPVDLEILDFFSNLVDDGVLRTFPVIALRHAKATPRSEWDGSDASRPLTERGRTQAKSIVGPLRAFGVRRIVTSDAVRCVETITPLSRALDRKPVKTEKISQGRLGGRRVRSACGRRPPHPRRQAGRAVQPWPGASRPALGDRAGHRHHPGVLPQQRSRPRACRVLGGAPLGHEPRIRDHRHRDAHPQSLTSLISRGSTQRVARRSPAVHLLGRVSLTVAHSVTVCPAPGPTHSRSKDPQ